MIYDYSFRKKTMNSNEDSQIQSEEEDEDDDDDDSDLVPLTSALKKPTKTVDEILTPRKARNSNINENIYSPLIDSPLHIVKSKSSRSKPKFSMDRLLKSKQKEDDIDNKDKEIIKMENCLKNEKEEEECSDTEEKALEQHDECSMNFSQTISPNDFTEDARNTDDSRGEENDGRVRNNIPDDDSSNDFPDSFPGQMMFTKPIETLDAQHVIGRLLYMSVDEEEELTNEYSAEELEHLSLEILEANIGLIHSPAYFELVWKLMVLSKDYQVSHLCFRFLCSQQDQSDGAWYPSLDMFVEALLKLGADLDVIGLIAGLKDTLTNKCLTSNNTVEVEFFDIRALRKVLHERLFNLEFILKTKTFYLQHYPLKYTIAELKYLMLVCMHLAVEKVAQMLLWELNILIGSILDAYSATQWYEELSDSVVAILSLKWHHRDFQHVVDCIVPTQRGLQLQQTLAYNTVLRFNDKVDITTESVVLPPITPQHVYERLCSMAVDDNTDYWLMNTLLTLIGIVSHVNTTPPARNHQWIKKIMFKLNSLNRDIKECLGRYADRSKVKDLLIRLENRYERSCSNLQVQSLLDSYFKTSNPSHGKILQQDASQNKSEEWK